MKLDLEQLEAKIGQADLKRSLGRVTKTIGLIIEADGLNVELGELCYIKTSEGKIKAEVVGFNDGITELMPLGEIHKIKMGAEVIPSRRQVSIKVGPELIGRVINAFGEALDDKPQPRLKEELAQWGDKINPLQKERITERLNFGVKAVDGMLSCGKGQRMGIFAGSGVGKSTLMGMIAQNSDADINVIALVGERAREVREFIEESLGPEGLKKSIVIVTTGNEPSLVRVKAALFAHSIAEHFRDQGKDVMLMLDSITRVALAQREIGLATGEPPATRGYTPSVFALIPRLLERSGTGASGSITALYTVLVEGDDLNEPVSDLCRGVLDGHVVLTRELAYQNHFPAIDILQSVSRVMPSITSSEHYNKANEIKALIASYRDAQDLINIGAYQQGSNPDIDAAIQAKPQIDAFLRQGITEFSTIEEVLETMNAIT
ncbi:MAG: FliI/YscN family ATPase [Candidatus Melainabacteria bacterium]|nr:FliI/YscN family ATPase [Candidatus Melainabacteria bacterium]